MTREYPANVIYDSVTEARVNALRGFGFTERQPQCLVTVMLHCGCFLERQYCAFTETVRGQSGRTAGDGPSMPARRVPRNRRIRRTHADKAQPERCR